jgi:hypothetical protein
MFTVLGSTVKAKQVKQVKLVSPFLEVNLVQVTRRRGALNKQTGGRNGGREILLAGVTRVGRHAGELGLRGYGHTQPRQAGGK